MRPQAFLRAPLPVARSRGCTARVHARLHGAGTVAAAAAAPREPRARPPRPALAHAGSTPISQPSPFAPCRPRPSSSSPAWQPAPPRPGPSGWPAARASLRPPSSRRAGMHGSRGSDLRRRAAKPRRVAHACRIRQRDDAPSPRRRAAPASCPLAPSVTLAGGSRNTTRGRVGGYHLQPHFLEHQGAQLLLDQLRVKRLTRVAALIAILRGRGRGQQDAGLLPKSTHTPPPDIVAAGARASRVPQAASRTPRTRGCQQAPR